MFRTKEEMRKIHMRKIGEAAIMFATTIVITWSMLCMLLFL